MQIFGIELGRTDRPEETIPSIAPPTKDDGAIVVTTPGAAGGFTGVFLDLEGAVRTESELINRYRDMSGHAEVIKAIDEIVNGAIVTEDGEKTIQILLDECPIPDNLKRIIEAEFDEVLRLLDFNTNCYDLFKRWYVDGRIYFLTIYDEKKPELGIRELRLLDPRKIRKIRQIKQSKDRRLNVTLTAVDKEYFLYSDKALLSGPTSQIMNFSSTATGVKIAKDTIVYVTSGLMNPQQNMVLSYLQPAIKPLNMLRSMEDSCVIYRISRAPERRIFYIDTGGLSPARAEEYVKSIMERHKNRVVFNSQTGEIIDDRKILTMQDDFYIPRRDGSTTEIDTLPAGENLGKIDDIKYFLNKLYESLHVPLSRLNPENVFEIGHASQITRDEVNFAKFIDRLRLKFNGIFLSILEKNLVLKRAVSPDEWNQIAYFIKFKYLADNDFAELKDLEILNLRLQAAQLIEPYVGRYYSNDWIRKHIHRQSEEDILLNDEQIAMEVDNPQFISPDLLMQQQEMEMQAQQQAPKQLSGPKKNK